MFSNKEIELTYVHGSFPKKAIKYTFVRTYMNPLSFPVLVPTKHIDFLGLVIRREIGTKISSYVEVHIGTQDLEWEDVELVKICVKTQYIPHILLRRHTYTWIRTYI